MSDETPLGAPPPRDGGRGCPLCGGSAQVALSLEMVAPPRLICLGCSLVWAGGAERPAPEAPEWEGRLLAGLSRKAQLDFLMASDWAAQRRDRPWRVLEVGCGDAQFLTLLAARGHACTGVDPRADVHGQTHAGVELIAGTLESAALPSGHYDLAIMSHVLEHFSDPLDALSRVREALSPEGVLLVEVPNVEHLTTRALSAARFLREDHVCDFSPLTLGWALERAGFARPQLDAGEQTYVLGQRILRVLRGMAQREASPRAEAPPMHMARSAAAFAHAVARARRDRVELARSYKARIAEGTAQGQPLFLWGAGRHTEMLMETGCLAGQRVAAVVDADPTRWGGEVAGGHRIMGPDELVTRLSLGGGVVVISSPAYEHEIAADLDSRLRLAGCRSKVKVLRLYTGDASPAGAPTLPPVPGEDSRGASWQPAS